MIRNKKRMLLAGASASAMLMSGGAVLAQDNDFQLEEILVTATKRNESIQDVPLAITAFDAKMTKRLNLDDVKELIKFAPGMAGDSQDSFLDFVNVRGISTNDFGNGGDPSIGFFKNNLYQGRTGSAVSSFFDIDRAEVLRGPQGFLFGRNAISGAISFHTARPRYEESSGSIDFELGQRGIFAGEAVLNIPAGENFAMRAAFYKSEEDGYIGNIARPNDDKLYGHDKWAARLSASAKGDNWDVFVMAEYENKKASGTAYTTVDSFSTAGEAGAYSSGISSYEWLQSISGVDVRPSADKRMINSDNSYGNDDHGKIASISAEINIDLDWAKFTSTTGYKDHEYAYAEDYDGTPIQIYDYAQDQEGEYFEQEFKLVSQGDGPLSWYAGASYFKEYIYSEFMQGSDENVICGAYYNYVNAYYDNLMTTPGQNCADLSTYWNYYYGPGYFDYQGTPQHNNEGNATRGHFSGWGAYIDLNYAVTEKFDMGVGIRYTKNKKDFGINVHPVDGGLGHWNIFPAGTANFVQEKRSWSDVTPRFIARYQATENMTFFASVTKGFKSGGFNTFGLLNPTGVVDGAGNAPDATPDAYEPEEVWSYEAGIKGTSEDRRIRYDMNVYRYKYTDLQLNYWDSGTKVINVGKVTAYGVEGSLQAALSENFDLLFAGSYNSNKISGAEFIEPDSDGNRLSGTPKFKVSGMLSYHTEITDTGELNASIDVSAQSSVFSSGLGNVEDAKLPKYSDVSLRLGYEDDAGWGVTAYMENVFNTVYYDGGYESGYPLPHVKFGVSAPRTVGVRFSYSFGE